MPLLLGVFMENIIFAFGEDGLLSVFDDLKALQLECEGIDVESGVWDFFNYKGEPIKPNFVTPNIVKKHLFGLISSVESSQNFLFVLEENNSEPNLKSVLETIVGLEDNNHFSNIAEVKCYLEQFDK